MNRLITAVLCAALFALAAGAGAALAVDVPLDTRHQDHRTTFKIVVDPEWPAILGTTTEGTARAFLEARAADFGLPADLANLTLAGERESLLARHVRFQQMLGGIPVDKAEAIVSIAKRDGRVLRAFNNTYPVADEDAALAQPTLDQEAAYDVAWRHVRAYGELRSAPRARLVYTPEGAAFRLNWLVDLDLDGPDGAWQVRVDAQTGQVVELADTRVVRFKTDETDRPLAERIAEHQGPLAYRPAAFAAVAARELERAGDLASPASRATGSGVVFDPDPRTTLRLDSLQDGSPASAFTAAYYTRTLLDIAFDGTVYRLNGPWVNILDWDSPATPPSTTPDGNWVRLRGNNSFNDAMTYFQLDQNQRYMQSLGFVGATGIQYGSIGADTDGFGGADNSAYYPGTNRLTFGHGCVDDNEDADVILHEYGHAINHDINNSWSGGDTGAMGEGFGDYWGASYSYSTPNGPLYRPDWIYSWDGHGSGNQCWAGRILNATGAQYVHSTYYQAHQQIPGGYWSDELWSTPIYQSLRTLVETHGQTRESVDQIMLESQFGLGSGLKMRDLANVIIATAQELQPSGPHAEVLVQKFLVHNIILAPLPAIGVDAFTITAEPSGNGAADPNESVDVSVTLSNSGLAGATNVSAVLSTAIDGVTVTQNSATFADLPVSGVATGNVDYEFSVAADVPCGTLITFNLQVSYTAGGSPAVVNRHLQLFTGVPVGGYGIQTPYVPLPDNDGTTIYSVITIAGTGATVSAGLNMDINVTHTYIGDLVLILVSPSGTLAYLHLFSGGSADNIIGNYPLTLTPGQSFDRFIGEPLDGDWTLRIRDGGANGTGSLNYWALYDIADFDCDLDVTGAPDALAPTRFALAQNAPNPFNPATTIAFDVPADAGTVTLAIFDVSGRKIRTLAQGSLPAGRYSRTWEGRDDSGRRVSSGLYFYKLTGSGFVETKKMVIVQ
ncbi:MAG TPA: proprotein convertase P-domain-containing protein [Candidatus Krumholzibacteria bacterium]|nr:proprotein convertase P-domain-containing protein [Candidatus Krumholzibacteria bacterium]HPD70738.1 proprotein convertase P-domain-containing protein [Candidatus Krumholzibacteria bacterium]HRY39562.1 proprotein convertase P-domain-containing protein [Candidatus Krumholzibacteria bacterium]